MPYKPTGEPHGRPALVTPPPCPRCQSERYRMPCGDIRCQKCHSERQKKYKRKVKQVRKREMELATCACGEEFQRSVRYGSRSCDSCRQEKNASIYTPSEAELEASIKEIQAGWTPAQRRQRLEDREEPLTIPQLDSAWLVPGGMDDRDVFNF